MSSSESPKPRQLRQRLRGAMRSSAGKSVMLYLLFVLVAFAFWMMLSLDSEVQKDYDVPVQLENVPDSITVITDVPSYLTVSVRAKGGQLLRYSWGNVPALKLDYRAYVQGARTTQPKMYISRAKLDSRLREYFGTGVSIVSVRPDTVSLLCTALPGHKYKLAVKADVSTVLQCIVSGPIRANIDSVTVYSLKPLPADVNMIQTAPIVLNDLRDTTYVNVNINQLPGTRVVPSTVRVMVPIEPLISKKVAVMVDVRGVPEGERVLTFPSKVDVNYLVPISSFAEEFPVRVYVDFQDTYLPGDKVPLKISRLPDELHNVSVHPDSVEYLIERTIHK